jgi:CubicO group peptidase (beta-lactamase class C family)
MSLKFKNCIILIFLGTALFTGCKPDKEITNGIIATKDKIIHCSNGVDIDTPFLIGSVSKQFAGVLVLKHLPNSLDVDIENYIKDNSFKGITLRKLLTHTSGLNGKTGYFYQNENYWIVGRVLEIATKRKYSDLIHELLMEAGMNNTFCQSEFSEQELFKKLERANNLITRIMD